MTNKIEFLYKDSQGDEIAAVTGDDVPSLMIGAHSGTRNVIHNTLTSSIAVLFTDETIAEARALAKTINDWADNRERAIKCSAN